MKKMYLFSVIIIAVVFMSSCEKTKTSSLSQLTNGIVQSSLTMV